MRDLGHVETFAAGAIGEPGDRTFYLQLSTAARTVSFVLEKRQVAALCEQALQLLARVGHKTEDDAAVGTSLVDPDEVEFRVGSMQLAYAEESELIQLVLAGADEDDELVTASMSLDQLDGAARAGLVAVASGRPACPRCGLAMDADGHVCPATNGDLRHHRA
jgi:uncharacterized repeat protein (TIGR03847 family)